MTTDKLLGLIFIGTMGFGAVMNVASDDTGAQPLPAPVVEIVEKTEVDVPPTDTLLDLYIPPVLNVPEPVAETPVEEEIGEEEIGDETLPVVELLPVELPPVEESRSSEDLRTLATLTADYGWKEVSDRVVALQVILGVTDDGIYGHMTRNAHIQALKDRELDYTIVPSVPTRNITPRCDQWWDTALSVGWEESELLQLGAIMYAESRCQPDAIGPTSDYGLAQINWTAHGERLSGKGITKQDLLDPVINLREAKAISEFGERAFGCKWQPWYMSGSWC